jgi:hypothetical protein
MSVKSKKSGGFGYTIVEVMIFLAVSGMMFLMAAVFINGKQAQATFQRGMDGAGANLTSLINNISDGQFNLPEGRFFCMSVGSGTPVINSSSVQDQGTNSGCVFLGTVLALGQTGASHESFDSYTVVGRQFAPTSGACAASAANIPAQSFCESAPVTTSSSLKSSGKWGYGLNLNKAYLCTNTTCSSKSSTDGIGIFSSFGSASIGGIQGTGAQTVNVVTFTNLSIGNIVNNIKDLSKAAPNAIGGLPNVLSNGQYILLCFDSGGKIGNITIGGTSSQLSSVSVSYNKGACA